MKIVSINCPNCAKSVNLDLDNLSAFCSYCGSKLMIDIETLQELFIEKEKTQQQINQQMHQERMEELSIKKDRQNLWRTIFGSTQFIYLLCLIVWCIFLIILIYLLSRMS